MGIDRERIAVATQWLAAAIAALDAAALAIGNVGEAEQSAERGLLHLAAARALLTTIEDTLVG